MEGEWQDRDHEESASRGSGQRLLVLILAAGLLFFCSVDAPLLEPQEVRYAEVARQMQVESSWIVPRLDGQDYLDKPPLFYWSILTSYQIFGMRDSSARVAVGLTGVLTVLATYFWGRRVLGERAGWYGALVLCLMPEFIYRGRMVTFDSLLTLWVTLGLGAGQIAWQSRRWSWKAWSISALASGLGLLTKGPVALVLIGAPLVVMNWLGRGTQRLGMREWGVYGIIVSVVALPWYMAILIHEPSFAQSFFWHHHVVRFVEPFDHQKPIWFYLSGLLMGLFPWLLVGLGLVRRMVGLEGEEVSAWPAGLGTILFSFVWTVGFFSLAGCKRPTYLLPAFPPLALAIGWYLQRGSRIDLWNEVSRMASWSALGTLAVCAGVAMVAWWVGMVSGPTGWLLAAMAGVGLVGVGISWGRLAYRQAAGITFSGMLVGVVVLLPNYNDLFSLRSQLKQLGSPRERGGQPIVCYPQRYESASYYLPGAQVRTFGSDQQKEMIAYLQSHPDTLLLVKSGAALKRVRAALAPGMQLDASPGRAAIVAGRVRQLRPEQFLARER